VWYQHVPYERARETFRVLLGASVERMDRELRSAHQ